jgi:signal transduction histidine kinase
VSHPSSRSTPLNTVSLRLRVTAAVIVVLAVMLVLTSVVVNAIFVAQSDRSLDALLTSRATLARQLARAGVGGQQIVNRTETDGVRAYLVLRNGTAFGTAPPTGAGIKSLTVTLNAPARVDGATLTLTLDTALVSGARQRLRRILVLVSLGALAVSALLVAGAVRLALRPLDSMAALAKTITEGNRGRRLAPTRTDTELGQTARAFDEMLDELEGAETRARQAEERTRAFLADAAHELRTPITGVQAAAETLLHHGDQLPAADREHLQALLVREAQRAGTLIADLLAAARLDAGVELNREPVSLGQLAAHELERVRLLHPEAIVSTGGGPDLVVTADADKIRGILRNVLENATRAAGPQGRIHLNLYAQDGMAVVDLWDSGPGVPPSERERIFERLVRLDHSRSADAGGSGLGLAIARGYARAHGGDLVCLDPGGPGALFRLTLPSDAAPTPLTPPGPQPMHAKRATAGHTLQRV